VEGDLFHQQDKQINHINACGNDGKKNRQVRDAAAAMESE
jgi:hypothetical protein